MENCEIINEANGKKSELQVKLAKAFNSEEKALDYMSKIAGKKFKAMFGDWQEEWSNGTPSLGMRRRTTAEGEPQLYKKKKTNQWYFKVDDAGTKFFLNKKKFADIPSEYIDDVTRVLAAEYLDSTGYKDFNGTEAEKVQGSIIKSIRETMEGYKDAANDPDNDFTTEEADLMIERANTVLKYEGDFRQEIISFVESLGQKFKETKLKDDDANISEEDKANNLNIAESYESNAKDSATVNTKIMLSQVEDVTVDGDLIGGDFIHIPGFVEFNEVWQTIQPVLSDVVGIGHGSKVMDIYDLMLIKLRELETIKPWMSGLIETVENLNEDKQTEFIQAFSSTKINFYVTEANINNKKEEASYKVMNATATGSRESQIVSQWGFNFQKDFLDRKGLTQEGKLMVETISQATNTLFDEFNQEYNLAGKVDENTTTENMDLIFERQNEAVLKASRGLLTQLEYLGIEGVTLDDIDTYILRNGGRDNMKDLINQLFNATKFSVKNILDPNTVLVVENDTFVNPIADETWFRVLAGSVGIRETDISESNILSNKGKSYYAYTNPSYLSNKINEWKQDILSRPEDDTEATLIEELAMLPYNANSHWIGWLSASEIKDPKERRLESIERLKALQIGIASSFKSKGRNDGVDNKDINYTDAVNDNITKMLGSIIGGKSYFPTIVPADKSRRIELEGFKSFKSGIDRNTDTGEVYIRPETIELFLGYFTDEYNRMKVVKREIETLPDNEKVVHYHTGNKNGLESQLFPEFSASFEGDAFQELRDSLYGPDGTPFTDDSSLGLTEDQKSLLRDAIHESLTARVEETKLELEDIDNINTNLAKHYDNNFYEGITALAGDYLVNGLIATVEYGKLFSGDPAYYKDAADLIKRIPATYTDGLQLRIKNGDNLVFNHAVVEGVEVASKYIDKIEASLTDKKIIDAYKRVNTTDAQAWITPRRWKFLKQRLGQWGPKHEKVYSKMMNGQTLLGEELKLAAQPLKGVYFEINDGRPVYLKYSQAVLLPNLVKGTPMEAIYDGMTKNPETGKAWGSKEGHKEIHEVITIDGVKVGAVAPTKIHIDGTTDVDPNFTLNPVELSNRGWKLQQDLPTKSIHDTNVGSQIQKNILSGMALNGTYKHNGKEITGRQLMQKIHDKVSQLSNIGKASLEKRFSIVDGKITDTDSIYDALIEEFKGRGGSDNIIAALEKETDFDAIPQIRSKVQNIFMSIMNKELTKISTNGGSFIQVSPFGLETVDLENSGIKIVSENYNDTALLPPRKDKDGNVLPGQAMMPYSEVARLLAENGHNIAEMTGDEIKMALNPEVLEIVAYRIPNQGMSSNDVLEIVGILPPGMGDTMIAYDAIPSKTGSDFDIDKMYVMSHHLVFNKETGLIEKERGDSTKAIQNELVDLYATVLKSPHTYDAMMTSIDGAFLKHDITGLFPAPTLGNLQAFSPLQQIKTKFEYMSGKFGVAQTANQLVDHVLNQSLNVGLTTYLGIGDFDTYKGKRYTRFDRELDQEHSVADSISAFLNAYVDIAKDPYISRGNHNGVTANTTFMLLRAGIPIEFINRFIGQPVLVDIVKAMQMSEGKTSKSLEFNGVRMTAEDYIKNTQGIPTLEDDPREILATLSAGELEAAIYNGREGVRDPLFDAKIVSAFIFLKGQAKNLSDSVMASKADSKGAGGSVMDRLVYKNKMLSVEGIRGFDQKFDNTMLGTYTENTIGWIGDVLNKSQLFMSATSAMEDTFNQISAVSGKGDLLVNSDFASVLDKAFYSYVMSGTRIFLDNNINSDELIKELPEKVLEMKALKDDNFFLNELQFSKHGRYEFMGLNSKNKPKYYQDKITRDWNRLYEVEETRQFAIDMVKYAFATSGFQNNLSQFFTYIPHEILQDAGVPSDLVTLKKNVENGDAMFDDNLIQQFLRHNADEPFVIPRISVKNTKQYKGNDPVTGFLYNPESEGKDISIKRKVGNMSIRTYPPFVTIMNKGNVQLYRNAGYIIDKNESKNPVYVRTYKLGHKTPKGNILEYQYDTKKTSSIIQENKMGSDLTNNIINMANLIVEDSNYLSLDQENEMLRRNQAAVEINKSDLMDEAALENVTDIKKPAGTYSFSYDGNTINTEFELGSEQMDALTDILDFITGKVASQKSSTGYMLQGSAGTGKTTIIGYVDQMLSKMGKGYGSFYMAPTHTAAVQLARTTIKLGNTRMPTTIASSVYVDKYKQKVYTWKMQQAMKTTRRPVVFVDESSMMDQGVFDLLMEASETAGVKVIFMGDIAQVPAVKKGRPGVVITQKKVSPAFEALDRSVLNKIYRQQKGTLLTMLDKIRKNNHFISYKAENTDGSIQFLDRGDYADAIENDVVNNSEDTVIISYSNKAVQESNVYARGLLGNEGAPKVGEQIIGYGGYDNKQVSDGDIANSVKYKIDEVIKDDDGAVYIKASSEVLTDLVNKGVKSIARTHGTQYRQLSSSDSFNFDLTEDQMEKNNKYVSKYMADIYQINQDLKNTKGNRGLMASLLNKKKSIQKALASFDLGGDYIYNPASKRMEEYNEVAHGHLMRYDWELKMKKGIDYGYAITIHKSQGLTIPNVYFDIGSINKMPGDPKIMDGDTQVTTEKNALYYVAMSRASNKLVIMNGYNYDETISEEVSEVTKKDVPLASDDPLTKAGVKETDMNGHAKKDIAMAKAASQFIGEKAGNANISSTEKYKDAWGSKANTGKYSTEDLIMVSGSGPWRGVTYVDIANKFDSFYEPLLNKGIEAKASFALGDAKGMDHLVGPHLLRNGYTKINNGMYDTYVIENCK